MNTATLVETVTTQGSIQVPRFTPEHYVLRKQCKRLMDNGTFVLQSKGEKVFTFTKS